MKAKQEIQRELIMSISQLLATKWRKDNYSTICEFVGRKVNTSSGRQHLKSVFEKIKHDRLTTKNELMSINSIFTWMELLYPKDEDNSEKTKK